ncbi:PREDICTED: putative glucose-6-phosphate 1-epimerase [Nicotiana attenuata]|uniref:putative glucose-6-phosphate 1-epimerase n=1 Tax=Nicotiana attenuata TaxID=49451 RepID=UPI000904FCBA|nr:PREDICTED: putative glucose-6-phosphate 1-epimerase [Nicotiana attenuata]
MVSELLLCQPCRWWVRVQQSLGKSRLRGANLSAESRQIPCGGANLSEDAESIRGGLSSSHHFSFSFNSEVRVEGLETLDYLENKERFTEQGDAITFESEVDKIYLSTPTKIAILDHEKKRTFVLRKDGLPDAVVWNPWDKKAKAMADFGDEEYKHMLCVEAAAVEKPITLKPGEEWRGRQELSAVPSSYCSGQLDPKRVLLGS